MGPTTAASLVSAWRLSLPKEHGAWFVLLACLAAGLGTMAAVRASTVVLVLAVFGAFFLENTLKLVAYVPALKDSRPALTVWAAVYAIVVLGCGAVLVFVSGLSYLAAMGAGYLGARALLFNGDPKQRLSLMREILGVAMLAGVVPAVRYSASGVLTREDAALWGMTAAAFIGGIMRVRFLTRRRKEAVIDHRSWVAAALPSCLYHAAILAFFLVAAASGDVARGAPLALIPGVLKAFYWAWPRDRIAIGIKQMGYSEVAQAVMFAGITIAVFGLS